FADKPVNEASSAVYRRAVESASKRAHDAVLSERFDEALKAQQERLEASLMMREALAFEREKAQAEKKFDRALKSREGLRPEEMPYLLQIQKILTDIGYTERTFAQPSEPLAAMVERSEGQLAVAHWLTDGTKLPPYKDMTVQQVRDLWKSIDSLANTGRQ